MPDICIVMPVYNEEDCIESVLDEWKKVLEELSVDYLILAINDGSKDGTLQKMYRFSDDHRVRVIDKPNSGHGPTVLLGYRIATDLSEWVFQCDSDAEMPASAFPKLWNQRQNADGVFGIRTGRQQAADRQIISIISRFVVRCLYGSAVIDVNSPYRLMKSQCLKQFISIMSDDTFAPNVIISGYFSKQKLKVINCPVPHTPRKTGRVSIKNWRLWKGALRSLRQTLFYYFKRPSTHE